MPAILGASHVALTVRDMEVSAEWYRRVFGWVEIARLDGSQAGSPRILLFDPGSGFVVGLCEPEDRTRDAFSHRRTGLDHLALLVADEAELTAWAEHLDGLGILHSPLRPVRPLGSFVSLEDPDGIQLELWVNAG
jgi:glyoxylase I family protein